MNLLAGGKTAFSKFVKKRKFSGKSIIISVIILLAVAIAITFFIAKSKKSAEKTEQSYKTAYAMVGNITETIQQSGTVEPYERREITSLVKGEIIASAFEEGDHVEEGQMLYRIDDEDAQLNIEKAKINLEETEENITNLSIYAPASGALSEFKLKEGENAQNGTVGYITDASVLKADIPFTSVDFNKISVGDNVTVTSALYMISFSGTVTHKYDGGVGTSSDGSSVKMVEVQLSNPGALGVGTTVAAVVNTDLGEVYSTDSGMVETSEPVSVSCQVSGSKVSKVYVKNGDRVEKGQLLATLNNSSLYTTKRSNELSLRSSQKTLENYTITAPISGTVITKNSKQGDKIDNSNSSTVMMVIADMSKMKFTISVDELDIAKIQIGQKVLVDADAINEQTFEGRVTSVAAEGTSSGDGVTTYQVEIVIDEPGELKSGMNVNANIIINQASNTIYVPEEAIMMARGTSGMVLVKSDGAKKMDESSVNTKVETNGEMSQRPEGKADGEMPQRPEAKADGEGQQPMGMNIPDGYELRRVVTGVSDGTNIQIVSGLSEGEEIIYIPTTASSTTGFMMGRMPGMGGMPGGMSGGMNRQGSGMSGGNRQGSGMSGSMRR